MPRMPIPMPRSRTGVSRLLPEEPSASAATNGTPATSSPVSALDSVSSA